MRHSVLFAAMLVAFTTTAQAADRLPIPAPARNNDATLQRLELMRTAFVAEFDDAESRPDYPLQDVYCPPPGSPSGHAAVGVSDTTPPLPPIDLVVDHESIHSLFARWSPAVDPESGIDYYAYAIGSTPGAADLWWWQSVGKGTGIYSTSLTTLGVVEGRELYISVYAVNGAGLASPRVSSGPVSFTWEDLGRPGNALTVGFAGYSLDAGGHRVEGGWEPAELQPLEHFVSRMVPIIKEIYGPPCHSGEVTLVKNLLYGSSNVYFLGSNEIHMAEFHPQLLTHELIHAYRDNVVLATDDYWRYNSRLSGFEEGFAQGVSYACMNRYIELYPDDPAVDPTGLYGSTVDWDYDLQNTAAITTEDFWSDSGGMGIYWFRYELGAAAMRKIQLEDDDFYRAFNAEYYARLNADHELTTSRDLVVDIIASIVPEIEGRPAADWLGAQRVFDCEIVPGTKIWVRTQHYPWNEFIIFQRIFHYETFENGSDWAHWDGAAGEWVYYGQNGSTGVGTVTDGAGTAIWTGGLLIEPTANPPQAMQYGWETLSFSTDDDLEPWPKGDPADYILGMEELGLYTMDLRFGETEEQVYRVIGSELRGTAGVFGGVRNGSGGQIYLDHADFPPEPPLPVVNGAFHGARAWASVANRRTGGTDSQPGKVRVRYVDDEGNQYLAQRNIDWGSWNGNQALLFDVEQMTPDPDPGAAGVAGVTPEPVRLAVHPNQPNPFNPYTRISYTLGEGAAVRILIHDAQGRRVRTMRVGRQAVGQHEVNWDGSTDAAGRAASGRYFYLVEAGDEKIRRQMTLIR